MLLKNKFGCKKKPNVYLSDHSTNFCFLFSTQNHIKCNVYLTMQFDRRGAVLQYQWKRQKLRCLKYGMQWEKDRMHVGLCNTNSTHTHTHSSEMHLFRMNMCVSWLVARTLTSKFIDIKRRVRANDDYTTLSFTYGLEVLCCCCCILFALIVRSFWSLVSRWYAHNLFLYFVHVY